ncbi:Asp-tRNA(Asn)/Glu-tRNA(Gln) amidotransferase subunit GatC [Marinoscillum furvescens]|uniref:Aspartyl/glutamyl-tRNA(Asn/Gln) amidotransferase subunit C n=1 Tax=Marinoscillum furvescens DSM 4134 TaxID=1122208 RepID=A0A3D9LL33_MARFU|nr:Asp-tRNA(Asn)/Glu-tRNA(Gln) amidotransferase subunit GatC [Marinoscillum furvescens]REE05972.1 aspartyl/glutamyl-tRNA(Asn/Gln) amidotransferase subunit C [Marinoscillum furvescens DSM 4134]
MKIDKDTLHKIAHLARVEIKPEKEEGYIKDLEEVLTWVEKLNELDTDGVEPLTNMSFEENALRPDERSHQLEHERALKNAPKADDDYFRVPKVLD